MNRVNEILKHDLFLYHLQANEEAETERIFCHHDMEHFLNVARIAVIKSYDEGVEAPREWIYAAALLHDLGKHIQYETGTPHEKASAEIAPEILTDCGFEDFETAVIVDAIAHHRDKDVAQEKNLRGLLYRADKASRVCFACKAEKECNWSDSKKNLGIRV